MLPFMQESLLRPLRVLFLNSDDLVAQVRLLPLLHILEASGRISLTTIDRDMHATGHRRGPYDVSLAHRNLGKRQFAWLRGRSIPLVYDIDDLLLSGGIGEVVRACLQQAGVVTSPSLCLLSTLDADMDGSIAHKSVLLPNAGRETRSDVDRPAGTPRLVWVSSAIPQAADGLVQVCRGIAKAAVQLRTETVLLGRFPAALVDALGPTRHIPWVPPPELLGWLAAQSLIAVAPLSTDLPPAAQAFADCKSDIKIAQYGSSGIAGVYSPAMPYRDSDLPRRIAAANDAVSWTTEILKAAGCYPDEGNALAHHPAFAARRPSVLAADLFEQLARAAAMGPPFAFKAVATPRFARLAEKTIRGWLR